MTATANLRAWQTRNPHDDRPLVSWCCRYCGQRTYAPKWDPRCGKCSAPHERRPAT